MENGAKVYLHPDSNTSTKIWAYARGNGEVEKRSSKFNAMRLADDDLAYAVIDRFTEFTAEGKVRRLHVGRHVLRQDVNYLTARVVEAQAKARNWREQYEEQLDRNIELVKISNEVLSILKDGFRLVRLNNQMVRLEDKVKASASSQEQRAYESLRSNY